MRGNMPASQIWFVIFAVVTIGSALAVVLSPNLVRSALYLVFTFLGLAALYAMLHAEFLFAMQILIYVGAVTVLFMFAVFLTQQVAQAKITLSSSSRFAGFLAAAGLFAFLCAAVVSQVAAAIGNKPAVADKIADGNTMKIGTALVTTGYLLPFELVSVILLAALVGAIVIGKEDKPEDASE